MVRLITNQLPNYFTQNTRRQSARATIVYSHTRLCEHCPLCHMCRCTRTLTHTHTHTERLQNHALKHAGMQRHHTHKQSYEQGLYTCTPIASIFVFFFSFFLSWRCTTRPWRAMKVMPVVQRRKCVRGGRLRGPAWNLQSPHRAPSLPGRGEHAPRWWHAAHQQAAFKPRRRYFAGRHLSSPFSGRPAAAAFSHRTCLPHVNFPWAQDGNVFYSATMNFSLNNTIFYFFYLVPSVFCLGRLSPSVQDDVCADFDARMPFWRSSSGGRFSLLASKWDVCHLKYDL